MADKTKIEWTDATWNPVRGCSVVSEGCHNCYAMQVAARFSQRYWEVWQGSTLICSAKQKLTEAEARNKVANEARNGVVMEARESSEGQAYAGLAYRNSSGAHWTGKVRLIEEHLEDPLRWKRPRRIFVNSMSDLFHESLSDADILAVMDVIRRAHDRGHTFQLLTKRPQRMRDFMSRLQFNSQRAGLMYLEDRGLNRQGHPICFAPVMRQLWLGVSTEDQKTADERIPLLLETPAAVRWISAEPLLGPIDLTEFVTKPINPAFGILSRYYGPDGFDKEGKQREYTREVVDNLHWVVAGGESGPGARPMHPDWARSIRDQCQAAGVPFYFKQWGAYADTWTDNSVMVEDVKPDNRRLMTRVGKKAAGHVLDGCEHREFPQSIIGENQNAGSKNR